MPTFSLKAGEPGKSPIDILNKIKSIRKVAYYTLEESKHADGLVSLHHDMMALFDDFKTLDADAPLSEDVETFFNHKDLLEFIEVYKYKVLEGLSFVQGLSEDDINKLADPQNE